MDIKQIRPDRLHTTIKGVPNDANSLTPYISSSREGMHCKHRSQTPIIKHPDINRIIVGSEREYGKYAFKDMMRERGRVIQTFPKYEKTYVGGRVINPPSYIVIYENQEQVLNYIEVHTYESRHQKFGYDMQLMNMDLLKPDTLLQEGTVFAQSKSIQSDGSQHTGVNARIALGSLPGVSEDGTIISTDLCDRLGLTYIEKYRLSFGSNSYPLSLYSDDHDIYKIFPDIGEFVNDCQVLFGTRDYRSGSAFSRMSNTELRKIDRLFDTLTAKTTDTEVIDIDVFTNDMTGPLSVPYNMAEQPRRYYKKLQTLHESIHRCVYGYMRDNKRARLSHDLNILLTRGFSYRPKQVIDIVKATDRTRKQTHKVDKSRKNVPIDEWVVDITVRRKVVPGLGYKLTGFFGANKGVNCEVRKPEDMPYDQYGQPLDIVLDALSSIKRIIPATPNEIYINASREWLERRILNGIQSREMTHLEAFDEVLEWSYIIGKEFGDNTAEAIKTDAHKIEYIDHIIEHGIYIQIPNDHDKVIEDVIADLAKRYPPATSKLVFTNYDGSKCLSKEDFVVGTSYMIILEKTPEAWAGVSSTRRNHYGVPSKLSSKDRNQTIGREQPTRSLGEGEKRPFLSVIGAEGTKRAVAFTANFKAHDQTLDSILASKTPLNIECAFDDVNNLKSNIVGIYELISNTMGMEIGYYNTLTNKVVK